MRCLWLAREIPLPSNTGDRIYSRNLADALAQSGVEVSFLGLGSADLRTLPGQAGVRWLPVSGTKKSNMMALFSRFPLVSAAHNTKAMRAALREQLNSEWEAIVLDHYGSSWMLERVLKFVAHSQYPVVVAHVSHNFEEKLAFTVLTANLRHWLRATVLFQNFLKIRYWERRLARSVDICSSITSEDRKCYDTIAPNVRKVVLTPGFSGKPNPSRVIDAGTPRRVILIGSFRWGVKELNLRSLLAAAEEPFQKNNISLDVIGDVPESLLKEFHGRSRHFHFHGFVDDYSPYLHNARIALVPEIVGGGFKLKFLDYIFGDIPIATILQASAGLPSDVRDAFIQADSMDDLVQKVIDNIDDLPALNRMKAAAFSAAKPKFSWSDRGAALRDCLFTPQST